MKLKSPQKQNSGLDWVAENWFGNRKIDFHEDPTLTSQRSASFLEVNQPAFPLSLLGIQLVLMSIDFSSFYDMPFRIDFLESKILASNYVVDYSLLFQIEKRLILLNTLVWLKNRTP